MLEESFSMLGLLTDSQQQDLMNFDFGQGSQS